MPNHQKVMRRAIDLVLKAKFKTEPNPVVGAVLADSRGMVLAGTGSLFVDKQTAN